MHRRHFLSATASAPLLALVDHAIAADKKPPRSPFLEGNFAPVREEVATMVLCVPREFYIHPGGLGLMVVSRSV